MATRGAPGDDKLNDSRLAGNDDEAKERYNKYKSRDPFPDIESALLNSADICDYVAATGMIFPFYPDEERLKPASYGLRLEGECIYWDPVGRKTEREIIEGESLTLESDSIAFVSLEPMIRLPDYIAARFNLRIRHVYQGLLVGTGPLVDPGFEGRISLPLHNLTANDYTLQGGEVLVWCEFTKLSDNKSWANELGEEPTREGSYQPFPVERKGLHLRDYLVMAAPHRAIRSSIPDATVAAEQAASLATKAATEAEEETKKWGKYASWGAAATVVALITLLVAIHSLIGDTNNLIGDAVDYVSSAQGEVRAFQEQRIGVEGTIEALQQEIDGLLRRIEQLELETAPLDEVMESSSPRPQTR